MNIHVKFFSKKFSNENSKKAYLEACKWVAINIINSVEIGETFWRIEKEKDADSPTFRLDLYAALSDKEFRDRFCDVCQAFHKRFYINQQFNCNACNMRTYIKRLTEKLDIKKQYRKERIDFIINKNQS